MTERVGGATASESPTQVETGAETPPKITPELPTEPRIRDIDDKPSGEDVAIRVAW